MITIAETLLFGAVCLIFGSMVGMTLIYAIVVAKESDEVRRNKTNNN